MSDPIFNPEMIPVLRDGRVVSEIPKITLTLPSLPQCDCGGAKAQTTHSDWCSTVARYTFYRGGKLVEVDDARETD